IFVSGSTLNIQGRFSAPQYLPISSICSLDQVDELWLAFVRGVPTSEEHERILRPLVSLKKLVVCGISPRYVVTGFGLTSTLQPVDPPLLCPHLDTIHIYGSVDPCPELLHEFAESRARQGRPLRQLRADWLQNDDFASLKK